MDQRKRSDSLVNWDLFVLRHQRMSNVFVHVISCCLFWFCPLLALFYSPWFWLGFFSSGLVGAAGHLLSGDGTVDRKEATSSMQAVKFSTQMVFLFLLGRYPEEVKRSRQKFEMYKAGQLSSSADPQLFGKLGEFV